MLIATIYFLYAFFGSGGSLEIETLFTDIKEQVEHAVADEDTRDRILDLSKDLAKQLEKNQDAFKNELDDLLELQKDYGATPDAYAKNAVEVEKTLFERYHDVLNTRSAMKKELSEAEWNAIFGSD